MNISWVFISILMAISDVTGRKDDMMTITDEEELMCCPQPTYLISDEDFPCFDPVNNTTTPNRVGCMTSIRTSNFTIKSGIVEYYTRSGEKKTNDSADVCYGDLSDNFTTSESTQILVICDKELITRFMIYHYTVITSVIFMSITAITYAIFRELRDVFGMSVTNYCGSFAFGLGMLHLQAIPMESGHTFCVGRGYLVYFFLLASFFWSNAISIQVLRDTRRTATVDRGWKEFRWYCLYSWGVPTILTTILAIVEHHPGDHKKPGFVRACWFINRTQQWYYLNGVLSILLLINLAIFIYITVVLWRLAAKKTYLKTLRYKSDSESEFPSTMTAEHSKISNRRKPAADANNKKRKQRSASNASTSRIWITARLILVMGLPWLLKMLLLAVSDVSLLTWFVVEMITALQGILVFLMMVVRKKVVRVLYQRGLLACCSGPVERWLAAKDDESCEIQRSEDIQIDDLTRD